NDKRHNGAGLASLDSLGALDCRCAPALDRRRVSVAMALDPAALGGTRVLRVSYLFVVGEPASSFRSATLRRTGSALGSLRAGWYSRVCRWTGDEFGGGCFRKHERKHSNLSRRF